MCDRRDVHDFRSRRRAGDCRAAYSTTGAGAVWVPAQAAYSRTGAGWTFSTTTRSTSTTGVVMYTGRRRFHRERWPQLHHFHNEGFSKDMAGTFNGRNGVKSKDKTEETTSAPGSTMCPAFFLMPRAVDCHLAHRPHCKTKRLAPETCALATGPEVTTGYSRARPPIVGVLIGVKDADLALVVAIANANDFAMTAPQGVEACVTNTHRRGRLVD